MSQFDLSSFRLPPNFRGRSALYVQIWWIVYSLFFRPSPQFFYGWRRFLLRKFGAKIGDRVLVRPTARITYPWKVEIGDNSWVGDDATLYSLGQIVIGANSVISQKSYLCTGTHDYDSSSFDIYSYPIKIGDGTWIAADVYVAPGVVVGSGSVVGARSSVYKDLPAGVLAIGSPAKIVRYLECDAEHQG